MAQYESFARVYDIFMDNVPYDKWGKYIVKLLKENKVKSGIVAELGCGTGSITRRLKTAGYDMIGIDLSEQMLQIAREKEPEGDDSVLYLCQDMREFELYGTVAAFVSVCDSMNYLVEDGDLETVFKLVNNYLDPDGVFIFDMNTPYYYRSVLGEQTICENRDIGSFIWENYYDPETKINEFDLTIYCDTAKLSGDISADTGDGSKITAETNAAKINTTKTNSAKSISAVGGKEIYERYEETHYQRAYSIAQVRSALKRAGLVLKGVYKACTKESPDRTAERVYFIAGK